VHVYVCGPRGMINAVRKTASALRWLLSQIHFESFGTRPIADDKAIRVHLARSKQTITVPADRSILDSLLDAGVSVPHNCQHGECTMCARAH
jgi:vanillate O-demethylase ferredoxin subunit